ncbi:MAG: hypothetical protein ACOY93_08565 [Bacillota bacterium]
MRPIQPTTVVLKTGNEDVDRLLQESLDHMGAAQQVYEKALLAEAGGELNKASCLFARTQIEQAAANLCLNMALVYLPTSQSSSLARSPGQLRTTCRRRR